MEFKRSLNAFKKKDNFKGALLLVVNHIVRCMEGNDKATKGGSLVEILLAVASDFPELNLSSNPLHGLECLVNILLSKGMVEDSLKLTSAPYPSALTVPVLELKLRIFFHEQNMEEFWKIFRAWEVHNMNIYAETTSILGTSFMNLDDEGYLEKSINYFSKGISMAKSQEQQSLLEKLEQQLREAEKKKKGETQLAPKEAKPVQIATVTSHEAALKLQQASEEAKRHERELLDEEARIVVEARRREKKREKKREKRKGKQIAEGSKKAVETKDEGTQDEGTKDEETKDEGTKDEGGTGEIIPLVEERRPRNFEIPFSVTMESDEDSFVGCIRTNTTGVHKSFIVVDQSQINYFQDLVYLCLRHETLLKVDQSFMDEGRYFLVTSENVCTIYCFFKRKLCIISPESNKVWWNAIKDSFWKVFRGVIRGLMYLFDKDKACGNLVFNSFVNSEGEGRILPYMASGKQKQDLVQLVDLMQSVIKLAVPDQSDISFLPYHLKQFFDNVTQFHGSCPLEFVIDQPYFWNTAEKVSFAFKLRELVKQNPHPILTELHQRQIYKDWWLTLKHVYKAVFDNAIKRKTTIKRYRYPIDIIRYYGAVYTHINELEYKKDRNNKRFSDEKIESDLARFFPDFYVDMFSVLCSCYQNTKLITNDSLRGLSTVHSFRGK